MRWISLLAALCGALAATWWLFAQLVTPWTWSAALWALIACLAGYLSRSSWLGAVWISVAAALLAISGAEAWLSWPFGGGPGGRFEGRITEDYYWSHDLLGYGPSKSGEYSVRRFVGDRKVYDTIYTIGEHGLRVTPVPLDPNPDRSVLFFGGSVTYGEGVADHESMPYRVGELVGATYQVYNFAFHGYGPHQMLATLEFSLYAAAVDEPVSYVIYQALPEQWVRTAGLTPWDLDGPRYVRGHNGSLSFTGSFSDGRGPILRRLFPFLNRMVVYRRAFGYEKGWSDDDLDLYVAVIARARDLARELFPGAQFHVIYWDRWGTALANAVHDRLVEAGFKPHLISEILPGFTTRAQDYQIDEQESHPNALAHDIIANYVASAILLNEN